MQNEYNRIPEEMKRYKQFVCWRFDHEGKKIPYNPKAGQPASVTDPATWANFDEAVKAAPYYNGIGFVLTRADPFFCIDFDGTEDPRIIKKQQELYARFGTWTERSQSGKGAHMWGYGAVPSGRRKDKIEIYSAERYMIMTGQVINNAPLRDCQGLLMQIWNEMGPEQKAPNEINDQPERESDAEIIRRASNAANGELFKKLYDGEWNGIYPSQSEADFAFIDMVAFYTQNKNQIIRIFRFSALGKRPKAKRDDYVRNMLQKAFDKLLPPVNLEAFKASIEAQISNIKAPVCIAQKEIYTAPPGLVGEIAKYIYNQAPSPVPEIALAGAIGLMAGICGRSYNISKLGLNLYIIMLARTGFGKEAMASGIGKLLQAIRFNVPDCIAFKGSPEIASSRALLRDLANSKTKSYTSIIPEFGLLFGQMNRRGTDPQLVLLRRIILALYTKSGHNEAFDSTIYSDRSKNIEAIISPAFSLLCESTPEEYYKSVSEELINQGLLPRFLTIEYKGNRPQFNGCHADAAPSQELRERLASLCAQSLMLNSQNKCVDVQYAPDAKAALDQFQLYCQAQMPEPARDAYDQIWSRGHVKALKLAALIAVGCNEINPIISLENANWAIEIIKDDSRNLTKRFDSGDIGQTEGNEEPQINEVRKLFKRYLCSKFEEVEKITKGTVRLHSEKIVPFDYISRLTLRLSCFRHDKIGATRALKRTLDTLEERGEIRLVSGAFYGFGGKCYISINI